MWLIQFCLTIGTIVQEVNQLVIGEAREACWVRAQRIRQASVSPCPGCEEEATDSRRGRS